MTSAEKKYVLAALKAEWTTTPVKQLETALDYGLLSDFQMDYVQLVRREYAQQQQGDE